MKTEKLIPTLYIASHMVEAGRWLRDPEAEKLDELTLSMQHPNGGCSWEFSIELRRSGSKSAMRLMMFDDTWKALAEVPEVFQMLTRYHKDSGEDSKDAFYRLVGDLQTLGWKLHKPEPTEGPKRCPTCGHQA